MIFDSHAHLDDDAFDSDREELLASLGDSGVGALINVSSDMESVASTVALADRYPFVYAAVGVHPSDCMYLTENDIRTVADIYTGNPKVCAIGEIGLDYHWDEVPRDIQKKWFIRFMDLAAELKAPVEIHSREAAADTLEIIRRYEGRVTGDMHCYSYSPEQAEILMKMGWRFGIGGVVTFKNARKLVETVKLLPKECILLETDCPYLAPEPHRGKRNDPRNLKHVVKKIAELRNETEEEVEEYTYENTCSLFNIPKSPAEKKTGAELPQG